MAGAALWGAQATNALDVPKLAPAPGTPEPPSAQPSAPAEKREPPPSEPRPYTRRLSNERNLSRWAYVVDQVWARRSPQARGTRVKFLREYVPGTYSDELVLTLVEKRLSNGEVWVQVRLPMRPNNRTGWVPRYKLGHYRVVRRLLVVNRRRFIAYLYDHRGRRIWGASIGIGTRRYPTPGGRFYTRERLVVPRGRARRMYGPFAFGTSAHSASLKGGNWGEGVIGVHGTGSPHLIPGRISHGCIRVHNERIQRLRRLMSLGTPIWVK